MSRPKLIKYSFMLILSVLCTQNIFAQVEPNPRVSLTGHTWNANDLAFNPDATVVATVSLDKTVRLWDTESGRELETLKNENALESVAISRKRDILVCGDQEGSITVWDLKEYNMVKSLEPKHVWVVRALNFTHNGKMLASAEWGWGETLKIWDTDTWEVIYGIDAGKVEDIAFSSDDSIIASGGLDDETVKIWDTETGELTQELKTGMEHVFGVEFMLDERKLLVSGKNGLQMWDVDSGELLHTFKDQDHAFVRDLALNPDGQLLACATENGHIYLWDVKNKKIVDTIDFHISRVNAVAFSLDGMTLASTGQEFSQYLWDIEPLGEIINPFSVSPKDKAAVLWGDLKSDVK